MKVGIKNKMLMQKKYLLNKYQAGVGIIELMVSVAIGLFLLLGLSTTFFNMKSTSNSRQGLSALQNKERIAMTFVAGSIQSAGQFTQPCVTNTAVECTSKLDTVFGATSPFSSGQVVSGTSGSVTGTDTFSTRFSSSASTDIVGCGAATTAGTTYTDTFSINASGNLVCVETPSGGTAASYTLVSGVGGMQVLYGVVTAGDSVGRYYTATSVPKWGDVQSVNVTLAFYPPTQTTCTLPTTWPSTWAAGATNKCVMISRIVGLTNDSVVVK